MIPDTQHRNTHFKSVLQLLCFLTHVVATKRGPVGIHTIREHRMDCTLSLHLPPIPLSISSQSLCTGCCILQSPSLPHPLALWCLRFCQFHIPGNIENNQNKNIVTKAFRICPNSFFTFYALQWGWRAFLILLSFPEHCRWNKQMFWRITQVGLHLYYLKGKTCFLKHIPDLVRVMNRVPEKRRLTDQKDAQETSTQSKARATHWPVSSHCSFHNKSSIRTT